MNVSHLHKARQSRSRDSQERLLRAAAELLLDRFWEGISIADIAQHAGLSVGGFYARFKSKDALLHVLHEEYEKKRTTHFRRFFQTHDPGAPLADRVAALVDLVADWMRDHRGVLRTFLLRAWSAPESFDPDFGDNLGEVYTQARDYLAGNRGEDSETMPNDAVRVAIHVLAATCRDALVLKRGSRSSTLGLADKPFKREMTRVLLSYLRPAAGQHYS
ncbi:MAG: TetR/AcrR family transcriptional regulator [Xanthomonadales bacterium]|nr:TetR/AcrR family transcriptional regulator [Xanthomonadales bacterium]